ncbi:MAG TPA: TRAP transporter small permease subunit [Kofleriaceae bacterium]|nr:TRAP transporter small permease subunit [Kofleriaceae bacterium]
MRPAPARAIERLGDLLFWLAGLLLLAVFAVNVFNVAARYAFGLGYVWLPDLSRILFVWMIFLGGAAAYIRGQHLVIDVVRTRLRARTRGASELLINAGLAAFFLFLIGAGVRITTVRMRIPYDSWDAVPTAVAYAAVPTAAAIMLLATLVRLVTKHAPRAAREDRRVAGPDDRATP